jgi:hypothetical protein
MVMALGTPSKRKIVIPAGVGDLNCIVHDKFVQAIGQIEFDGHGGVSYEALSNGVGDIG